ncbi:TPA: DNA adenine methylase [Salmonella enterica subsp. enterica serovar Enteritidis]|nr:Dam family site-specific DNA-(adenine-N6)-methyltransferase [Salmonella enterica]
MNGILNQRSPLKWAGGKFDVVPQLREHLPKASYLIEPFVGGGSVFMNTDYDRYVLCDSNPALINFYRLLTYNTAALIDRAWSFFKDGGTREAYEHNRQVFNAITLSTARLRSVYLEWAALFLYLNRHGFNGMQRTNQKGEFNIPFGKHNLPYFPYMEMRLFADKARDTMTRFVCADFRTTMKGLPDICHRVSFHAGTPSDTVIYCDPPYLPLEDKDSFTHYNGKAFICTSNSQKQRARSRLCASRQSSAIWQTTLTRLSGLSTTRNNPEFRPCQPGAFVHPCETEVRP